MAELRYEALGLVQHGRGGHAAGSGLKVGEETHEEEEL